MDMSQALAQRFPYVRCEYSDRDRPLAWTGSLYIWTGASESTIYPSPGLNWQFRAHHDALHRQLKVGFSFDEERTVTQEGIRALKLQCSPLLADLYWADNVGQQEYYRQHGAFPSNQQQFIHQYLEELWQ